MEKIKSTGALPASPEPCSRVDIERRCGDLQRLLAAWPSEISDVSVSGRRRTLSRLEKALRQERARGRAGHWAYDVARHQQLAHHLRVEQAALKAQQSQDRRQNAQPPAAQTQKTRV